MNGTSASTTAYRLQLTPQQAERVQQLLNKEGITLHPEPVPENSPIGHANASPALP